MTTILFPGIVAHSVVTPRLIANVLERPAVGDPIATVVFVHGNVSSSLFFQPTMLALPAGFRALAVDLRGFGDSETLPVDATRGLRDFSDDVLSVLDALALEQVHLVGWSMGGGVVMSLLLDAPERALSVTLEAPVSPYGFGGTHGSDGARNDADGAGTGGGERIPTSSRGCRPVTRVPTSRPRRAACTGRRTSPGPSCRRRTKTPGSRRCSPRRPAPTTTRATRWHPRSWPGFAAGTRGVLNTMAPQHFDVSGIAELAVKPPILWIHGEKDAIVSDGSYFDLNMLGQVGVIPGWPGAEIAPPQPMKVQTRAVLDRYRANGGTYREVALAEAGHAPHLDEAVTFDAELAQHITS